MLIVLLFVVLLALKLAALTLVYYGGPIAAIPVIAACLAAAYYLEPTAAKQPRPTRR